MYQHFEVEEMYTYVATNDVGEVGGIISFESVEIV